MGHRVLFTKLDKTTGITTFDAKPPKDFILPVKCALGTAALFELAKKKVCKDIETLASAHHSAHPSPLAK
jgi:hypothetical protein